MKQPAKADPFEAIDNPYQRQMMAISILQRHILADDSLSKGMFGHLELSMPALELAERLFSSVLSDLEDFEKEDWKNNV